MILNTLNYTKLDDLSKEEIVIKAIRQILGRTAKEEEIKYYSNIETNLLLFTLKTSREAKRDVYLINLELKEIDMYDLLLLNGYHFIEGAYLAIFGRSCDLDGLQNYEQKLNNNLLSKTDILIELKKSEEANKLNTNIIGLPKNNTIKRINSKIPLVKNIIKNYNYKQNIYLKEDEIVFENTKFNPIKLENKKHLTKEVKDEILKYRVQYGPRMKVLMVSRLYPPTISGGAEIIAHNQAKAMVDSLINEVIVFTLDLSEKHPFGYTYYEYVDNILVIKVSTNKDNLNIDGINFYDSYINDIFEEVVELYNPEVVHIHNIIWMSLNIIDIAKKYKAKTIVTLHDNWGFCYKNTCLDNESKICNDFNNCDNCLKELRSGGIHIPMEVRRNYLFRQLSKVDAFISPSNYLKDNYLKAKIENINVISNGIDVDRYKNINKTKSSTLRLTFAGLFGKHKGVDLIIKALNELKDRDILLQLVGDGEELDNYKELVEQYELNNKVKFLGRINNDDMIKIYSNTDILVLPSRWPENQPVSITEALSCGIPVIASDLGGNRELIIDDINGYLFESNNYLDLKDKILKCLDNRKHLELLSSNAKMKMMTNTFNTSAFKINKLYDNTIIKKFHKPIKAIKGLDIKDNEYLELDWLSEEDYKDIELLVINENEKISNKQKELLIKYNIPVIINNEEYKELGLNIKYEKE